MSRIIEFSPKQAYVAICSSSFIRKIFQYHSGYSTDLNHSIITTREKIYIHKIRQLSNWRYKIDKIILHEINKHIDYEGNGLGNINQYYSIKNKNINKNVKESILKSLWAPSVLKVFQHKFLEWNYRPGNPGYIRTLNHYNSL